MQSLMYALGCISPNIAFAIRMLGRYQSNSGLEHIRTTKKVSLYLQRTKDHMLTYRRSDQLEVIWYTNSDFASCFGTKRSNLGYIFLLAGGVISWRSAKQSLIATSTIEVKFVSCCELSTQASCPRNFITGLGIIDSISRPLRIYCDNSAMVSIAKSN